jgi:tetratricopeptide (TPR) repeat protein
MSIGWMTVFLALASLVGCGKAKQAENQPPAPAVAPPPAAEPAPEGYDGEALGALHFNISGGTPEARKHFDRGLLALHSFWYDEATKQFQAAIDADKSFSMAYWGLAMSHAKLLWLDDDLAAGRDALSRMPGPNLLPPHDQAWVVAALALFRRADADAPTSRKEFLAVMEQLHAQYPDDESALFLALALLSTIHPNDPDETKIRERAGGLAMEVFARNPKHPGAAHYIIHAFDTPELAARALPAAQAYAKIAPAAFHALHMPAHVFVRLGMWKEAVASCQAAWDASVAWVQRDKLSADHEDFHSLAWLIELNFERGHRKDAEKALATYADAVRGGLGHDKRAAYANQVGSVLWRTGDWDKVDELLKPLDDAKATDDAGGAMGCGHPATAGPPTALFEQRAVLGTRAQAAAMRHDVALLTKVLGERDAVDAQIRPFLVATQSKEFVESSDKLRKFVRDSLFARARGDDRALIVAEHPLADDQEASDFIGEGTPPGLLHHEQIAEALVRIGQYKQALDELKGVLAKHAGRTRTLLDAARAAAKVGDGAASRDFYQKLLAAWSDADEGTDGVVEARTASHP